MAQGKLLSVVAVASFAAFAAFALPAQAEEGNSSRGFYGSLGAGAAFFDDSDLEGAAITNSNADFDVGPAIIGSLGYAYGNGFRTEIEVGYRSADIDRVSGVASASGDAETWNFMLNALYDFDVGTRFSPYVGAGVGALHANFDNVSIPGATVDETDTQFAYQAIAGVSYDLGDNFQLFADYRYLASTDLDLSTTGGAGLEGEFSSHNAMAGLRFFFGPAPAPKRQPEPVLSEALPPLPPPPPEPEKPMNYLVFFDWDRSDLTAEAQRIVASAAANAVIGGISVIEATGHADRSGPDWYNEGLSERRAETVRNELIRLGVPAESIVIAWKGEREPLVPTADGVREPQNRRVEIIFN